MGEQHDDAGLFRTMGNGLSKLFPDREIFVRSNGRVGYVSMSRRRQLVLASFSGLLLVGLIGWTAFSTINYVIADRRLASQNAEVGKILATKTQEIERAVAAYDNLRSNLTDAERKAVDMAKALEDQGSQLQANLEQNRALKRNLHAVETVLDSVVAQRTRVSNERAVLETRVQTLEARIKQMQGQQTEVLARFGDRTKTEIDQVERVVAMTGLDTDLMLVRTGSGKGGQGGPFVPALGSREFDVQPEPGMYTAAMLDTHMDRLEGLQKLMRQIPLIAPADAFNLTSGFGIRRDPVNGTAAMHYGLDMAGQLKQTIVATAPGRVVFADRKGFYGRLVEIDHGMGISTRYGHLNSIDVEEGQVVAAGEKIGTMGSSGRSTGVHVHYEIRIDGEPANPMKFLKAGRYVLKN